jgi:hypothetical protein
MNEANDGDVVLCARCNEELRHGQGKLYTVYIVAVSDPSPPRLPSMTADTIRQEIERTLRELDGLSALEASEGVSRTLTINFCKPCYDIWIEAPATP